MVMVQDATFHIKMHIYRFTLREQNHVYLPVRGDLWPYKIQQIRLRPGLRPGPRCGAYDSHPDHLCGEGTREGIPSPDGRASETPPLDPRALGARLCSDKFCLKMPCLAEYSKDSRIEFACFSFHVALLVIPLLVFTLSSLKLHTENNACVLCASVSC